MTTQYKPQVSSPGEQAVDGLFAGLVSGVAMAAYLLLAALFGYGWLAEQGGLAPWTLVLGHLAVSGIYGILFALATRPLLRLTSSRIVQVSAGAIYGLLLYGLASAFFLPRVLEGSLALPAGHLLAAHLLYGLSLALRGPGR